MKKYIPNTITLLNLLSGCMAIYCAFRPLQYFGGTPGYMYAFYFILLAAAADFCDGLCARLLGTYSDLGKQLDSLSDLVSFGVAPAMLLMNLFEAGAPQMDLHAVPGHTGGRSIKTGPLQYRQLAGDYIQGAAYPCSGIVLHRPGSDDGRRPWSEPLRSSRMRDCHIAAHGGPGQYVFS